MQIFMSSQKSPLTNSYYGSEHWFNTLIGRQKAIAELLSNSAPTKEQNKQLADSMFSSIRELMKGWGIIQEELEELKRIKLT